MPLSYEAPPGELAIELEEVRSDAAALAAVFDQVNAPLPDSFPKQAVTDIANGLRHLPDGTARGCLRPLNEAQAQLAAIPQPAYFARSGFAARSRGAAPLPWGAG